MSQAHHRPGQKSPYPILPPQYVGPLVVSELQAIENLAVTQGARVIHVNLEACQNQRELLQTIGKALRFPAYFGTNLDALYDCLTDHMVVSMRAEDHGVLIVLHQLSAVPSLDQEQREQLLDAFRDAADFHSELRRIFQVLWD